MPAAWSSDGRWVAAGSELRRVRVYETTMGAQVAELRGHGGCAWCVCWSPDARFLASASFDGTVRVWDSKANWSCVRVLENHRTSVRTVAWSPDGRHLASGSMDGVVKICDVENEWIVVQSLKGRATREVSSVVWNGDGTRLAISTRSGEVRVWRIENNVVADGANEEMVDLKSVVAHDEFVPRFALTENADRVAYLATLGTSRKVAHTPAKKRLREPRRKDKIKVKMARLHAQEQGVEEGLTRATKEAERLLLGSNRESFT